jgi:hypothetical protein
MGEASPYLFSTFLIAKYLEDLFSSYMTHQLVVGIKNFLDQLSKISFLQEEIHFILTSARDAPDELPLVA